MRRGLPALLAEGMARQPPKGEMVVLVAPPAPQDVTDEAIAARLEPLLAEMSLSEASKTVSDALGVAKGRAYDVGLGLKKAGGT